MSTLSVASVTALDSNTNLSLTTANGSLVIANNELTIQPYTPPPPPPITQVTMRQARLVLLNNDLLDSVEQVIEQAPKAVQIEWEYATVIYRDSELVSQIASQLELGVEQIDALFQEAHTL
jgi:hypothetical protein